MTVVIATSGSITLELEPVDGTPPAVRVTVSGVTSTTVFTLQRLCEGRTVTVPGWRARQFVDSVVDMDWAAPTNRPITYTLLVNGVTVTSATVTLPSAYAWLRTHCSRRSPSASASPGTMSGPQSWTTSP